MNKQKYIYYGVLVLLLAACTSTAIVSMVTKNDKENSPKLIPDVTRAPISNGDTNEFDNAQQSSTDIGKKTVSNKDKSKSTNTKRPEKSTPAPTTNMKFEAPVIGKVTLEFSNDKPVFSKTLQEWRTHSGVDIQGDIGVAVLAAQSGVIEAVKEDPRYGVTVVIDHSNDLKSIYSNLSKEVSVTVGQKVKTGDVIGSIGDTAAFESLEATHLHFEILKKNVCLNPCEYVTTLK